MKSLIAIALLVGSVANAVVFPEGYERPILGAELRTSDEVSYPVARYLTLNKKDGSEKATSFTLQEDTGIRCITTPCPSERTTTFTIQNISYHGHGDVRYEAVEVLKNIPANVKIAPRHLIVEQSSMELVAPGGGGFMQRLYWHVEVQTFGQPDVNYIGNPEYLMSILTENN